MTLAELLGRPPVVPWSGETKIPWDDPEFSARMLREHLSQAHDRASRRRETVERHVEWIDRAVLGGRRGRVLDLGCGPGLYTQALAVRGHACVGVDFSPASIEHARAEAERAGLTIEYHLADVRSVALGGGFDLVLLTFGEFNTFHPDDARALLANASAALAPGGALVLEAHREASVRALGGSGTSWFVAPQGVFSDEPHLCLREARWHEAERVATEEFLVAPLDGAPVARFVSTTKAWSDADYAELLRRAGFADAERQGSLAGTEADPDLFVLVART